MASDASSTERIPPLTTADIDRILTDGSLELEGRIVGASNASFYGQVSLDGVELPCIYKPIAGERPLWDFPDGTLAGRERAARLVSDAAGWDVVPPTVLRDGRFGPGMVQQWIEDSRVHALVDVILVDEVRAGWIAVLEAQDTEGQDVLLVHADHERLRDLAVFDVVANNADRKGGHVLVASADGDLLWGCDHGVSFHAENKLRTVLWGWADETLRERDQSALDRLSERLTGDLRGALSDLLTEPEVSALAHRVERLRAEGRMPVPDGSWPAIPWPAF
jgi:uncharacterized repeat protein (TIGR03843 family)